MSLSEDVVKSLNISLKVRNIEGGFLLMTNDIINSAYNSRAVISELIRLSGTAEVNGGDPWTVAEGIEVMKERLAMLQGEMIDQIKRLNMLISQIEEAQGSLDIAKSTISIMEKVHFINIKKDLGDIK